MHIKLENLRFDKYLTVTASGDIASFASPIIQESKIDHFSYSRTYPDHSGFCLTTDPDFSELFNTEKFYELVFLDSLENYIDGYYLWEFFVKGSKIGEALNEYLGLQAGVTIIRNKLPCYCEFYHYATKNISLTANHYFINQQEYFKRISSIFDKELEKIINIGDKNRIIYPSKFNDSIFSLNDEDKAFFKSLTLTYKERFTKREAETFSCIRRGLSAKEIGEQLGISPRTVEKYIASLKQKTNSSNIKELIVNLL